MIDMKEWLRHHNACYEVFAWAIRDCETMHDVWDKAKPEWLIWVAARKGAMSEIDQHKFALWSAKQVEHLMTDPRSIAALRAKELWIEGRLTDEELAAASAAARDAARDAASAAAWDAASAAARAAARDAAWAAAWDAARDAASAAARDAAWAAAWDAASATQTSWIRENCTPTFEVLK